MNCDTFKKTYGSGKVLKVEIRDILGVPVDAIVNPANSGLSHGGGLAAIISEEAGPKLDNECERIIKKIGRIPTTFAVPTKAYNLNYKGIIHAVGPRMGAGDEQVKIEKTINNSLLVADKKGWQSVGFPAISTGIFGVPKEICAEAFKTSIPDFFGGKSKSTVDLVWLCLTKEDYPIFAEILSNE